MVKMKNVSNGFCLWSCMSSKSPVNLLSATLNFLRKLHKTNIFGMPPKIQPYSYIHSSLYWPYFIEL